MQFIIRLDLKGVRIVKVTLRERPTYIYNDGRVEIKCTVNDKEQRIFMTLEEYMMFLADQVNALTHYVTGKTNPLIKPRT
jgi:hypothetical protein